MGNSKEWSVFSLTTMVALGEYLALGERENHWHWQWGGTLLFGWGMVCSWEKALKGVPGSLGKDTWHWKERCPSLGVAMGRCAVSRKGLPAPWDGCRGLPSP